MVVKGNTYGKKKTRDHAGVSPLRTFVVQRAIHSEHVSIFSISRLEGLEVPHNVGGKDNNDMRPQIFRHHHPLLMEARLR